MGTVLIAAIEEEAETSLPLALLAVVSLPHGRAKEPIRTLPKPLQLLALD